MPRKAWVMVLALGFVASCASTPDADGTLPSASTGSAGVSSVDFARRNGLTKRFEPERNRLILEGPGSRVVLYPGTTVATVNGTRVQPMRRIRLLPNEVCELVAADAQHIESMLRHPPKARPVPPPGPRRQPAPALEPRPAGPHLNGATLAAVRVPLTRKWGYIVIHHSGTASGNAASFGRHHKRDRGWDGLGYHFVIGNGRGSSDGELETGFRWTQQLTGAHAGKAADGSNLMNETGIGICLVGNFNETYPTARQLATLRSLLAFLQGYCGIPPDHLLLHRDVRGTDCPGRHFSMHDLAEGQARP